jgi:hypothetical protein
VSQRPYTPTPKRKPQWARQKAEPNAIQLQEQA